LLLGTKLTAAQIHDQVDAVREQLVKTEEQLENSKAETERFLSEGRINEEPCANLYRPFSPDRYLMSGDVFLMYSDLRQRFEGLARTLQPILDVDREVEAQRNELHKIEDALKERKNEVADRDSEIRDLDSKIAELATISGQKKMELARIEQRQLLSIHGWLLNKYPDKTVHGDAADRRIMVTTTLFGTFVADYPAALAPKAPAEINVIFAPAIFQEEAELSQLKVAAFLLEE